MGMRVMRWGLGMLLALWMGSVGVYGAVYRISPDNVAELVSLKSVYTASPSAESCFEYAMSLAYNGQVEKGWGVLKKIPTYDPDYAGKVVAKYRGVIAQSPSNWKAHFKLAFGYYFMNKKDLTVVHMERAAALDPQNPWPVGYLALVKGEMGQMDEAVRLAKRAIQLEPNAAALHFLLSTGYYKQGKWVEASQSLVTSGRLLIQEKRVYGKY
ncbi:hypothetical protein EBZ35_07735 [bacterium]|nr:hypothetical protein [bacterium]